MDFKSFSKSANQNTPEKTEDSSVIETYQLTTEEAKNLFNITKKLNEDVEDGKAVYTLIKLKIVD